ncbi:MAG: fibronectin type III domain-containing protein, partial [Bacteroidota bacterium]
MRLLSTTTLLLLATILFARTEKYRLTLRDNPATSIVIGWNQISGSNAVVYYGTTDYGTNWSSYPSSKSVSRSVTSKGMNNRFARLTGLAPNTAYYFVIRDNDGTSRRFWFKTAPNDPNARLSFIAGGDSRNNRTPRRNANLLVSKLKPHAVFFGGDMTDRSTNSQWQTWFDDWQLTISSDGRMYPVVATRGNHEGSNSDIVNLFDVPSSSVYYAITFGGGLIRTYTLNTEISISGSQTSWLSSDLSANRNVIWKMAQYHKPMRPHVSSKREGNSQYSNWANLFYTNDVKLVVECDAHTVKTTWPVRPSSGSGSDEGFIRDNQNGTVYVGEGCWGAPLRSNNDGKTWKRNSGRFNQFKWIFIDRNKIEVRTVRVDNASSVGQVSNSNPFTFPSNVDVWSPSNGSVVTIQNGSSGGGTTIPRPTNLAASSASSSSINLTWSDNSTGEDGFKIERRQGAGSWTQIGTATTGSTSYTSTGLSASTTYSYRIRAYLGSNHSTYSNTASATTQSSGGGSSCSSAASINEGFESGFGNWSFQSYDLNWTRQSGSTPSSGTGPTGAARGNYYLYIEASSPNYP